MNLCESLVNTNVVAIHLCYTLFYDIIHYITSHFRMSVLRIQNLVLPIGYC